MTEATYSSVFVTFPLDADRVLQEAEDNAPTRCTAYTLGQGTEIWWAVQGSNLRPPACK